MTETTRPHLVTGEPTTAPEPRIHYTGGGAELWHGDCIETMTLLEAGSFDAVITDPPYGIEFMGAAWDKFTAAEFEKWCQAWAEQAYRLLKPGGHLIAFGGTRTWHRLASGIEDAGFDIRDNMAWLYASGFPKSLDVSSAIDRQKDNRDRLLQFTAWCASARDAAGLTNSDIDREFGTNGMAGHWTSQKQQPAVPTLEQIPALLALFGLTIDSVPDDIRDLIVDLNGQKGQPGAAWFERPVTGVHEKPAHAATWREKYGEGVVNSDTTRRDEPATEAAREWQGWGTALKPAFEPIVVARKPLAGTVAVNVLTYGTGGINIDAARVPMSDADADADADRINAMHAGMNLDEYERPVGVSLNLSATPMPQKAANAHELGRFPSNVLLTHAPLRDPLSGDPIGDGCAFGCIEGCPVRELGEPAKFYPAFRFEAKAPSRERPAVIDESGNTIQHPTVKPLALIRWIVRLFVRGGGRILEPFTGSGTTVEAAIIEGDECVGIELGAEHLPLAVKRISKDHQQTLFGDLA